MTGRASAQLRGVAILGGSALIFRVFALLAVDWTGPRPALWMSAALGALMALPAAAVFLKREGEAPPLGRGSPRCRAACGVIGLLSVYDAAVSSRLFSVLAVYAALPDHSAVSLSLPLIAAAALVCLMGAGAMSAAAVVWRRAALALGLVALLVQARALRPVRLLPLLGGGAAPILDGAERAAGHMALAALGVGLLGRGDRARRLRALRSLGVSVLLCAGMIALYEMLVPALPGMAASRLFQIEMLADCGQNGAAAELLYILMMAGGMLLAGFELMTACAALRAVLPGVPYPACVCVCCAAAALLCRGACSGEAAAQAVGAWYYPAAMTAALLAAMPDRRREAAA